MRISTIYGFTFLCMPKCASTSIEDALMPYCDLVTKNKTVSLKHTNYKNYSRYIEPYILKLTGVKPEVVCVMREPIDWLMSWYKYRRRKEISNSEKSTENITFAEFCEKYLQKRAKVGKQSNFIMDSDGQVGVDKIFKYEELWKLKDYFEEKIGNKIEFPSKNISPKAEIDIPEDLKDRLINYLERDYEIYNNIK